MIETIKKDLLNNISKTRYDHTLRVVETCKELALEYKADLEKTEIAALLHDSAKFISKETIINLAKEYELVDGQMDLYNSELIHGPLASKIAVDKYDIVDEDILNAIRYHTTGRRKMSLLEKIIFMGDYIEPSRSFNGIEEIREQAFQDLDGAMLLALNSNIEFLMKKGKIISIDSVDARNYLLEENMKRKGMNI